MASRITFTSCFGIDEFFRLRLRSRWQLRLGLDRATHAVCGNLPPRQGWSQSLENPRQSGVFCIQPSSVSRHAVVMSPLVKPVRRRHTFLGVVPNVESSGSYGCPQSIREHNPGIRKVLRRGLIWHQLESSYSESPIYACRSMARTEVKLTA